MARLEIQLLGSLHVILDGQPVTNLRYDKVRALLAYLAVEANHSHSRDALAALLWPDAPAQAARKSLRNALATLRLAIGDMDARPPFLLIARETIQFNRDSDTSLDVITFSDALATVERHVHADGVLCADCAAQLTQAVARYHGEFIAQVSVPDSVAFEEWAALKREQLHRHTLNALMRLVAYHEQRADDTEVRTHAYTVLEIEPWDEAAHRALIRLFARRGQRPAALAQYERCRKMLEAELGVEPSIETTTLAERIRTGSLEIAVGRHIWRDTDHAEVDTSSLAHIADAVNSSDPLQVVPLTNLPAPPSPLIGREPDIALLRARIQEEPTRMLTLVGPPGIGKTRLGLAVATTLQNAFADGVYVVELAPIRDPALVLTAIAKPLGVKELGSQPLAELLKSYLRDKALLLVLDNFEHMLAAAPLIADLLSASPHLTILATSRAPLHVRAERQFPVAPLELPDPTKLMDVRAVAQASAVALFVERAQAVAPAFALTSENAAPVATICARLDGLPLTIELAAAYSAELAPPALLAQLTRRLPMLTDGPRDLPERQRTLRAAIGWSYDLLTPEEQQLFCRLAVFAGGWTLSAAETVCQDQGDLSFTIRAGLVALAQKSLLQPNSAMDDEPRWSMLETIREYAYERLEASDEAEEIHRRHAAYYLTLAETASSHLRGAQVLEWLARLEQEHDNLRAALVWFQTAGDGAEQHVRLVGALWDFWLFHSHLGEGRARLRDALDRPSSAQNSLARAWALFGAGVLAGYQGDGTEAERYGSASLAMYRALEDHLGAGYALALLGMMAMRIGDRTLSLSLYQESLTLGQLTDDIFQRALLLNMLGRTLFMSGGDAAEVYAILTDALAAGRTVEHPYLVAQALRMLGMVALQQQEGEQARAYFAESLVLCRNLGERLLMALNLHMLAELEQGNDTTEQARHYRNESLTLLRELGINSEQISLFNTL